MCAMLEEKKTSVNKDNKKAKRGKVMYSHLCSVYMSVSEEKRKTINM